MEYASGDKVKTPTTTSSPGPTTKTIKKAAVPGPKTPKKQEKLIWDGCHSSALSDWKQEHLEAEFKMNRLDWQMLSVEVVLPQRNR